MMLQLLIGGGAKRDDNGNETVDSKEATVALLIDTGFQGC